MSSPSPLVARRVMVVLILLSLVLLGLLIVPFASAFFLAAVLAGALTGSTERLARLLRGRRELAAGLVCALVVLVVILPLGGLLSFLVREGLEGFRWVNETMKAGGLSGLLEALPDPVERLLSAALARLHLEEGELQAAFSKQLSAQGGKAAIAVSGAVAAGGTFVVQSVMMLIALFFLLVDGAALVEWLEKVMPLRTGQTREILLEFRKVLVAVMVSSLLTAAVQAGAALVGYLIARVPHPVFFTFATFLVAFIPAAGATAVVLVASALLALTGHPWAAAFLAIWGVAVVGVVDNIIKPILVKRGLDLHGAIVFFALLGGLSIFGTIGLLLGPLIVSFFLALLRIFERDYGGGLQAEPLPPASSAPVTEPSSLPEPPPPPEPPAPSPA